jgi:hypothetical protein
VTAAGWLFMTLSLTFVLALAVFCYVKVLRSKPHEERHDTDR